VVRKSYGILIDDLRTILRHDYDLQQILRCFVNQAHSILVPSCLTADCSN